MRSCVVDGCLKPHRARGLCVTHYNQRHSQRHPAEVEFACHRCGSPCLKRPDPRRPRHYCSLTCRTAEQYKEVRLNRPPPAPPPSVELVHVGTPHQARAARSLARTQMRPFWTRWSLLVAGSCPMCGRNFVALAASAPTESWYCSIRCRRAASKARRRAVERGAYVADVSPRRIFERDRWICKLCGKRVKRTAKVPDPKAPVVDHIVPLAAGPENGGVHAPWNAQCAHFLCNSVKQANWSQGALF